jgi:hypothetical protein
MTQTQTPAPSLAWCQALQAKLMAALDAVWALLEHSHDPGEIRQARDKAKAIGDLAAMARKVALTVPTPRPARAALAVAADMDLSVLADSVGAFASMTAPAAVPVAAQAEHARRALEKLKGGRRGRP